MTRRLSLLLVGLALSLAGCKSSSTTSSGGDGDSDPYSLAMSSANRRISANNLKIIGLALHSHMNEKNMLPPGAICDPQGKPLLSWRVAILPYIEHENLFRQFKLNEPWDSENNKRLIPMMPKTYLLPGSGKESDGITHYRVFVNVPSRAGNHGTMFPWPDPQMRQAPKGLRFTGVTDGLSNTIMVAEAEEGVVWTKPEELEYDPNKPVPKLLFNKTGNSQVLMGDGSYRTITKKISEQTLRALITANGGEILGTDW